MVKAALMWLYGHGLPFGLTEWISARLRRWRWFREG